MRALFARIVGFLRELKRRKVYQVTALYALLAVGGLEILDLLIPETRLPEWASPFFLGLAVVGLPLVIVFAWTFDITPGGVVKTADDDAPEPAEPGGAPTPRPTEAGPDPTTVPEEAVPDDEAELDPLVVAVLPFENLSGEATAEPFAVGLHDDLLTELSRASALTVISRTSVRCYQDSDKGVRQIGRELGAGTVVEGSVQQVGRRVRLNVQLIDSRIDVHRWAERYDRELSAETIFDLQSELAAQIMGALRAELTSEEAGRIQSRPTEDLDAYRFYVRGRTQLELWSEDTLHRAVQYFQQAIDQDRDYAPAWAGLADAVSLLRWYEYRVPDDAPSPEVSARRALELDPELAEAHASYAIVHCSRDRQDAPRALEALTRAVELRPSYASAQIWMAWLRLVTGEPHRALEPAERASELDPLAPAPRIFLAETYLANGRTEEALREVVRGRELQPQHAFSHYMESLVLHHLGRPERAARAVERALDLLSPGATVPTPDQARALLAVIRAGGGDDAGARELLDRIDARSDPCSVGLVHAALGDVQAALRAFEEVTDWGQLSIEHLRYFFPDALGPVRETDRYAELLRRADRSWKLDPDAR